MDEPEIPLKKMSPKPNQIYIAETILGSIISIAIIFLKEWLNENGEEFRTFYLEMNNISVLLKDFRNYCRQDVILIINL